MARRRSRRRKSSYRPEGESNGYPPELVLEELSPRARRLVEGGVIDVGMIAGSGEDGKITSGDILHAARVMEMEQSVARIESVGNGEQDSPDSQGEAENPGPPDLIHEEPVADEAEDVPAVAPTAAAAEMPEVTDSATTSGTKVGGEPVAVSPTPWDAYNGVSEGLAESALPGAEQSWGEAEAHIAAIAEEAAAQGQSVELPVGSTDQRPVDTEARPEPHADEPLAVDQPATTVAGLAESEAAVADHPAVEDEPESVDETRDESKQERVMMDFGTLEMVDPDSVWAEGAEDFAPWFLAHSRQLGDVLGLDAGLTDARQFTTKSATGVVGRDDAGEDVVVVSSQAATAEDSDLGRALGMAASSGAATVALVSARFDTEQLKALAWLNNQTKSGVKWYGIEMKVVRIADSPAAMLFELVASPPHD